MAESTKEDLARARECFVAEQIAHGFNSETAAATANSDRFGDLIHFGSRQRAKERTRIVAALREHGGEAGGCYAMIADAIESGKL